MSGTEKWPHGVFLKFTHGDQLGPLTMVLVNALQPMDSTDVRVQMISPSRTGIYQGQWRMCTPTGQYFGGEYSDSYVYCTVFNLGAYTVRSIQ